MLLSFISFTINFLLLLSVDMCGMLVREAVLVSAEPFTFTVRAFSRRFLSKVTYKFFHIHKLMAEAAMQGANCSSGATWGSVS